MTREEAQKELVELEPRELQAWLDHKSEIRAWQDEYDSLNARMSKMVSERDKATDATNKRWLPLHTRKQQLKSFLELTS